MGSAPTAEHDRIRLPPVAASAGLARRFVREAMARRQTGETTERVLLLTTELVTNALLHAGTPIDLCVGVAGDRIRVEVADSSPQPPDPRGYAVDAPTGRGLSLVAAEAQAWGVEPRGSGKVVWFEVAAAAPAPVASANGDGSVPHGS